MSEEQLLQNDLEEVASGRELENDYDYDAESTEQEDAALAAAYDFDEDSSKEPAPDSSADDSASGDDQTAQAETQTASNDGFTADMLETARGYGFSEADARAFGTPRNLAQAMSVYRDRLLELDRISTGLQVDQPKPAAEAKKPDPIQPFDLKAAGIDPETTDPEIIKLAEAMNGHYAGLLQQQQQTLSLLQENWSRAQSEAEAAQMNTLVERLDAWVAGDGKAYAQELGTGSRNKLTEGTPEFNNSVKLTRRAMLLAQEPDAPSDFGELMRQAANSLFGSKAEAKAQEAVVEKLKERGKQAIGKPDQRNGLPAKNPREEAIANLERRLKDAGLRE